MIMINGNWEQIKDLSDVLRIVSENINDEFSKIIEDMFEKQYEDFKSEIYNLSDEIEDLEIEYSDYDDILYKLNNLNDRLEYLEKYINKNKDGTDFMNGMIKAFEIMKYDE